MLLIIMRGRISCMIRTQIQLPDEMFQRVKVLADAQEWSMAEAVRRALEGLLAVYGGARVPSSEWSMPVLDLGVRLIADDESLRGLANERGAP